MSEKTDHRRVGGVAISDFHLNSLKAAIDDDALDVFFCKLFLILHFCLILLKQTPSSVMRMENDAASASVDASCSAEPQQQGEVD